MGAATKRYTGSESGSGFRRRICHHEPPRPRRGRGRLSSDAARSAVPPMAWMAGLSEPGCVTMARNWRGGNRLIGTFSAHSFSCRLVADSGELTGWGGGGIMNCGSDGLYAIWDNLRWAYGGL